MRCRMRDDYVRDYVLISQSVLVVFVPTIWDAVHSFGWVKSQRAHCQALLRQLNF